MITLTRAIEIACDAHKSQKDKGGFSYIHHPITVMMAIKDDGGSEDDMIVAVLHDVVEDSDWTIGTLRKEGLTEYQLAAIDALTKTDEPTVTLSTDEEI
jgi:(p)ppGpp synthase/HD superfamily hydrolase